MFYFEKDIFWSPKLLHLNSKTFRSLKSDDFERGMRIYNEGIYASFTYGLFENHCDLDLRTFPFDKYVILAITMNSPFHNFNF